MTYFIINKFNVANKRYLFSEDFNSESADLNSEFCVFPLSLMTSNIMLCNSNVLWKCLWSLFNTTLRPSNVSLKFVSCKFDEEENKLLCKNKSVEGNNCNE